MEYRLEELATQVRSSIPVEASRVWSVCLSLWEALVSDLKKIPRYGASKMQYCGSKEYVCTFGSVSSPSLLWTALDSPSAASDDYGSKIFGQPMMHLAVVLGASGVGKTRTILEWGSQRDCIILTDHAESAVEDYWRSHDILAVTHHLLKLFGSDSPITLLAALSACVGAMLTLEFLKLGAKDIFELLSVKLMKTFVLEGEDEQWDDVSSRFLQIVEEIQAKMDWNGFIAINECQEVNKYLPDRLASVTLGQRQRSTTKRTQKAIFIIFITLVDHLNIGLS
ncbi:hypothetical protein L7F22_058851 [Adiantum nelumboides]|nr:hypothetical protein [Adiantum nelumboides]